MSAVDRAADVIVIGAGAVGAAVALELADRGASVVLLERGPAPAAGCSYGNAGMVGAGLVTPLASPETLLEGVRSLVQRRGPVGISLSPAVASWVARYVLAATPARARRSGQILHALARESAELHLALAQRFHVELQHRGFLEVYESASAFAAAGRKAAHAAHSVSTLDATAAMQACKQLRTPPAGAILAPEEAHCDPGRLVEMLVNAATGLGARVHTGVDVLGLLREGRRVTGVLTTEGPVTASEVVVAAGAWSRDVVRELPIHVPALGGKGYHVEFPLAEGDTRIPVKFPEHRVVVTPLPDRLRVTGMLHLAGTDMSVDIASVEGILRHVRRLLTGTEGRPVRSVWRGLRPCSPDGLPIVGRVPAVENITLATGHGMWGVQLAPVTARIVADILVGKPDEEILHPLRPERFDGIRRMRHLRGHTVQSMTASPG